MNRDDLITAHAFDVKVFANGIDISSRTPALSVKYNRDGTVVEGSWRYCNAQQTQIEVQGPEGISRWNVIELNGRIYRKANLDTGIEFIHVPRSA